MKPNPIISFVFLISALLLFTDCSNLQKSQFTLELKNSELVIDQDVWKMQFNGNETQHFSASKPFQFLIDDNWVSVSSVKEIESSDSSGTMFSVLLENELEAEMEIIKVSDFALRLLIKTSDPEATACRGYISLDPVEEIYGFGEMWNGRVAQRGSSIEIWDKTGTPDECAYMPYYVSTKNYALFLNYGGKVNFDIGKTKANELVFEATTGQLELLIVSGDKISSVVENFLTVVGMPAQPPRWTYKPWIWLMGDPAIPGSDIETLKDYHTVEMVDRMKDLNIPIGVTWLEPPWQTERTTFIPNPDFSSDLKKVIAQLEEKGIKTLAWTVPYTTYKASNWKEAVENGYLVKKPGGEDGDGKVTISKSGELVGINYNYIDFSNPDAYNWFKTQISIALDLGFKGFKLDAGQGLQKDAILHNGVLGADVHNSYAMKYNQVFFETLSERYDDDFLMIPRAAWVGSSAFTNFKWPGDLSVTFANNGLPSSLYSTLSLAFSGFPFVSTDIGGFEYRPASEEVWIRWAQFGAMLPGMQTLNMPWWYSDKAIEHYRFLSWLHTDMTPLWASLANEAHETGAPVCRPLVWTYQDDIDCWRVDDEFTVGNVLLVAPVLNTENQREVYLPEGRWLDFWNEDKILDGKQTITWKKSEKEGLWSFPLYIKEGAIIPLEVENEISGFGWDQEGEYITLAIWPAKSKTNSFVLHDLEEPVEINVDWQDQISITLTETKKNYIFRVHLNDSTQPVSISSGSVVIDENPNEHSFRTENLSEWHFNKKDNNLWIRINSDTGIDAIKIEL